MDTEPGDCLVFAGPFDRACTTELLLTNRTSDVLAWKLQFTRDGPSYTARPSAGFLAPAGRQAVEVTFAGGQDLPMREKPDKAQVVWQEVTAVPAHVETRQALEVFKGVHVDASHRSRLQCYCLPPEGNAAVVARMDTAAAAVAATSTELAGVRARLRAAERGTADAAGATVETVAAAEALLRQLPRQHGAPADLLAAPVVLRQLAGAHGKQRGASLRFTAMHAVLMAVLAVLVAVLAVRR